MTTGTHRTETTVPTPIYRDSNVPDVSTAVVCHVASVTDSDPTALPPLYDAIDPEALNRLVDGSDELVVEFEYDGFRVTVTGDGEIDLRPLEP